MPTRRTLAIIISALLVLPLVVEAQVNILTNRYDPQRTGANLSERILTPASVSAARFGKLYTYPVDGAVYAQPLYVSGVTIGGVSHNVLYVATMNDKLYAFDADSASPAPLWTAAFAAPPASTPIPITDIVPPNLNIVGNVGIQGTPVIDLATHTLYLVARTKESGHYVQRLHAVDIATGRPRAGSPVTIAGSVPGNAPDSIATSSGRRMIAFDPKVHVQRAGLALTHGVVLVAWAAHEDMTPSHGWVMGFDAATLAPVATVAVTPDVSAGGIWQGGRAPAIDAAGNAYFATGNGGWDGVRNFGESLMKFSVSTSGLTLLDYFTPGNEAQLTVNDDDLSGSGFTLLPGTNLLLGGGKEGVLYLIDADHLGHKVANDTQIVQKIPVNGGHVMGGPVFWHSSTAGPLVYNWSEDDVLTAFQLANGRLTAVPYALGSVKSPGHPGGSLTVSANGSESGSGIVWASMPTSQDAKHGLHAGILRAFHAETLQELWNSDQKPARDQVGTLMRFVPPVVVNGKVYLPNQDNAVAVYGLLPDDFSVQVTPASQTVVPGTQATFSVSVPAQNGFTSPVTLSASGQPSGTAVSFNPLSVTAGGTSTMTVSVPSSAPGSTFSLRITGSSGAVSYVSAPVVVNVTPTSGGGGSGAIGINFVGTATTMGATETAGVVTMSHWNNAAGPRGTALTLMDDGGGATAT